MSVFKLFLSYALQHKRSYILGIVAIFGTNWLAVNIPVHIGLSIDLINRSVTDHYPELMRHIYTVMIFAVTMIVTRTLSRMWFFNPGRDVERSLKNDAFDKLTALQKDFYHSHQTGSLISIVNNDINGVRAMAGVGMMQLFNIVFALSLTPIKMWQISPALTLYCLVPVIVAFLVVNQAISYFRQLMQQRMALLQTLSTNTVNLLNGVELIKSYHIQHWAIKEFAADNQQLLDCSLKQLRVRTFFMPLLEYTEALLKIVILSVGGFYLIEQSLTLGELTAFLAYSALLAMPFLSLGRIISTFQMGVISLKSVMGILLADTESQLILTEQQRQSLFSQGIQLKQLSYRYPDQHSQDDTPALSDINLHIKPGEKVAVLGKVGSGKSTLVNCLNRYLNVSPGQIFIDGRDVTEFSRSDLRSAVRTVTQQPFLFSDTVEHNIQFGATEHGETLSIEQALYHSAMLDEVQQFPAAEKTLVGEKGILLSGGQKQRLSLARAMYTPCKLVVLDNVLSAVDNQTERFLLQQIFDGMRSEASLIVSHRPAVMERVDRIILLDQGRIVAEGSHHQLLANSAIYRSTWEVLQKGEHQADSDTLTEVEH
jgi:ATP-binding cassette subfamily B protein